MTARRTAPDAGDTPDREAITLAGCAADLAAAVEDALEGWVRACVEARLAPPWPDGVTAAVGTAGAAAQADIAPRLRDLLALDIDDQWTNPLAIIRSAVRYPTEVLAAAGAGEVERDDTARRLHPDDVYDLTPAAFADLGPDAHEAGLAWGAAKAYVHLQRRNRKERA